MCVFFLGGEGGLKPVQGLGLCPAPAGHGAGAAPGGEGGEIPGVTRSVVWSSTRASPGLGFESSTLITERAPKAHKSEVSHVLKMRANPG